MTRWILAGCIIASFVACDSSTTAPGIGGGVMVPDAALVAQIAPASFFIGTPFACSGVGVFNPSFALVVTPLRSGSASIESATFQLIDGTTLGGPAVTFPQPRLTQMFGSTVIVQRRTFNFAPAFQCPVVVPLSMHADIVVNEGGVSRHLSASLAFE